MIDSPLSFAAPTSALSPSAKLSPTALSKTEGAEVVFSELLTQSAELAGNITEPVSEQVNTTERANARSDEDILPDEITAAAGGGMDIATLIAQVSREIQPVYFAAVPASTDAAAESATPDEESNSAAPALSTMPRAREVMRGIVDLTDAEPIPLGTAAEATRVSTASVSAATETALVVASNPAIRVTDRAAASVVLVAASPLMTTGAEDASPIQPVNTVIAQPAPASVTGAGPLPKINGRESDGPGEPALRVTGAVLQHAANDEIQSGRATQKGDEPTQNSANPTEAALYVNLTVGDTVPTVTARVTAYTGPVSTLLVPTHIESPAWSKDFGQHVIRLANEGRPSAEIHLNPPDLGPITVSIELKDQVASLQFSAENLPTREALETAMPRLREMFASNNLTLAGADVSAGTFSQQPFNSSHQGFGQSRAANGQGNAPETDTAAPAVDTPSRVRTANSQVDLFA